MATEAQTIPRLPVAIPHPDLVSETWELYKRALLKLMRRPFVLYFSIIQPMIWLLLFGQMFKKLTDMPGAAASFGTSNYMAFFTPGVITMTMLFGSGQSGLGLIQDMDSGFLDKLLTTPINRISIIAGKMGGDLTRMILQVGIVLLVATVGGVRIKTGLLGVFFIILIGSLFGLSLGGLNTMLALRTRNTEATFLIGNFINLPLMFTSSAMLPKSMMPDWMQTIAKINPITIGIEGMRGLVTTGFDPGKVFGAVVVLAAVATVTILSSTLMFRSRVG